MKKRPLIGLNVSYGNDFYQEEVIQTGVGTSDFVLLPPLERIGVGFIPDALATGYVEFTSDTIDRILAGTAIWQTSPILTGGAVKSDRIQSGVALRLVSTAGNIRMVVTCTSEAE